jgi:hypothetical protein
MLAAGLVVAAVLGAGTHQLLAADKDPAAPNQQLVVPAGWEILEVVHGPNPAGGDHWTIRAKDASGVIHYLVYWNTKGETKPTWHVTTIAKPIDQVFN